MFSVGLISQSNAGFTCEVRLDGEIWALCYGKTCEEARRRAEITVRALNRYRRTS